MIAAMVGVPVPAAAAGEITVPRITLNVSAHGSPTVFQKITTDRRGYSPKTTVEADVARRVHQVLIKSMVGAVASVCPGKGTWSCAGSLESTGYIQISYSQLYSRVPLELGTFTVAVSTGDNEQTFSGSGSVTVTTSAELEMLTPRLTSLGGTGYATFQIRNNGVVPSPASLAVGGLSTVAVDDQGSGCSRSGTSLICEGTIQVGATYLVQLKTTGNAWRGLRLTGMPQAHTPIRRRATTP